MNMVIFVYVFCSSVTIVSVCLLDIINYNHIMSPYKNSRKKKMQKHHNVQDTIS